MSPTDPKSLGTFNAIDRSKQYTRADNAELLRSLNLAWAEIRKYERELSAAVDQIRGLQKELAAKDSEIDGLRKDLVLSNKLKRRYRISTVALTSIITGLAWEGLKALINLVK